MKTESKDANVTATPVTDFEAGTEQLGKRRSANQIPWTSIVCLVAAAAAAIGGAILVVCLDNNIQWPSKVYLGSVAGHGLQMALLSPAVILSLLHSITTLCIGIALKDGIAIAWWRMTLRGETVDRLNKHYGFGTSIKNALLAGWSFNFIALATISAFIVGLAQGPLMQDALRTTLSSETDLTTVSATIHHNFPNGLTGFITDGNDPTISALTPLFLEALEGHANNSAISPLLNGCTGVCHTTIQAIGFTPRCSTSTSSLTLRSFDTATQPILFETQWTEGYSGEFPGTTILLDSVFYSTSTVNASTCTGILTHRKCVLQYGIVEFPIIVQSKSPDSVTISMDLSKSSFNTMVTPATFSDSPDGPLYRQGIQSLQGYLLGFQQLFTSSFLITYSDEGFGFSSKGTLAQENWHEAVTSTGAPVYPRCAMNFTDPTEQIMRAVNDISLRTAVIFSNASTPVQTVVASEVSPVSRYSTNYVYLAASLAVVIIGILLIAPVFWGFWELTHKVSFNPMEIAEAFKAPALQQREEYRDADHLLKMVGHRKIRYAHDDEDSSVTKHLVVVDETHVAPPPPLKRVVTGTWRDLKNSFIPKGNK